jgi:hypothetical protein
MKPPGGPRMTTAAPGALPLRFAYSPHPTRRPPRRCATRRHRRRRPRRPVARHRPRTARRRDRGARRRRPHRRGQPRHLLRQAHAGNLRPPRRRREPRRQGRDLAARPGLPRRARTLRFRPSARDGPPPAGLHQHPAISRRGGARGAGDGTSGPRRPALVEPGHGHRARGRRCRPHHRDAGRSLPPRRRLGDRLRRLALAPERA